jgi:hypothetical protein
MWHNWIHVLIISDRNPLGVDEMFAPHRVPLAVPGFWFCWLFLWLDHNFPHLYMDMFRYPMVSPFQTFPDYEPENVPHGHAR